MLLTKIKLSGFKSFVDSTTVHIPSRLVAIVGPNGCGKSNIIDAVCWVMGESSAKYLRGESLTDVIFSGSSARKPVGQASVELVFDNQDGSIGGEYASFAEISIRRVINRESESSYYLNGTRCRRRDITDIFLGTGLGPRSYSIIGQNMISRIIEAKPDDMRVYLEEAAGVSKYKERRRETENRIHQTKENLARLHDVHGELEKQLGNLKRQAIAAEKYKQLRQEERMVKAQWLSSQWRQLDSKLVQYSLQIQQQETGLEAKYTDLSELSLQTERKREEQRLANEAFQEVQRKYYAAGNEITKVEQDIRHTHEKQKQRQVDLEQIDKDSQEVKAQLEKIETELRNLGQETRQVEPALQEAVKISKDANTAHDEIEESMQVLQEQWDDLIGNIAKTTKTAEVEQTRIIHFEQKLATIQARKNQIQQEKDQINPGELDKEINRLNDLAVEMHAVSDGYHEQLSKVQTELTSTQNHLQKTTQELDQIRNNVQKLRGQQSSLEALQQTALGQKDNSTNQWLAKVNLDKNSRLAQNIEVEAGWEDAVEKVLGVHLQDICVNSITAANDSLDEFKKGNVGLYASEINHSNSTNDAKKLLTKVTSELPLESLLGHVYFAESKEDAFALVKSLKSYESVITRDGVWLSPNWLRLTREENPDSGIFQREQELKQLAKQIKQLAEQQQDLETQLSNAREKVKSLEKEREDVQTALNQAQMQTAQTETQRKMKQEKQNEFSARLEKLQSELSNSNEQYQQTEKELATSRVTWQQALEALEEYADSRESFASKREQIKDDLFHAKQKLNDAKESAHRLEIRLQTAKSQQQALQQNEARLRTQLTTLNQRHGVLETEVGGTPLAELELILSNSLASRLRIESELNEVRTAISQIDSEIRNLEFTKQETEREIAKIRDMLETLRLESQGLKVKNETLIEQLREIHFNIEDIIKDLAEDTIPEECHHQLEQIILRISRLGAINLVAIEEYSTCSERKEYLDKQLADLHEGLQTLENAIAKIDKETRAKFKDTFDKVNTQFQELFPRIFGGGRAYLELTGENLLDSGISVMACPPGKRNSTIHLLSGGEKAMTAIALIFSIFHLNPAPFCLLDEVDAPLDDANIGRYCDLVKAMSEKTQFLFISHNKLAIEMGEHLMGVTMNEPGVSRLVTVDITEAMSLAGT